MASGLPVSREIGIYPGNNLPVNYLGRGSDGRTPVYSQTDMVVQHSFRMASGRSLSVSLNVLNLFNQDTTVGRYSTYQQGNNSVTPDEHAFYAGTQTLASLIPTQAVKDPRFLMDQFFQNPLQARFGIKFLF